MGYWVNQNHMGGIYFTEEYQNHETCEQCGDCDMTIDNISTMKELERILEDCDFADWYKEEIIEEFEELIK